MERAIARLTSDQFKKLVPKKTDRVILPVGTIEAHGVIPLATDVMIPSALGEKLAERLNTLVAPSVNYGITRSLLAYPGSLTVKSGTFEAYVAEILCSLARAGFRTVIVLNGHGGQNDELKRAGQKLYEEAKAKSVVVHWWLFAADITHQVYGRPGGHAFLDETGMVVATTPALVDMKNYGPADHYFKKTGIEPFPFPARVGIYEPTTPGLDFDVRKAKRLFAATVKAIGDELETILARWQAASL